MLNLTYNDVLSTYANYPAPIRPYLLRAETHPDLRSIFSKSCMRVVIDVLARAPIADPFRALKLRIDNIAADLDLSTKTVSRSLNLLSKKKWLKRLPGTDGRNGWGKFCASEFVIGEELRAMLGLPTATIPTTSSVTIATIDSTSDDIPSPVASTVEPMTSIQPCVVINSVTDVPKHDLLPNQPVELRQMTALEPQDAPNETKMSDGVYIGVNKVFKKEASFSNEAFPKNTQTKKTNKFKVPPDLLELQTELGIRPFGIFKLMRLAGQLKQRLQDVWHAKREQILSSGAKGGRAKNYLEFLLNTGEDFAYRARQTRVKPASVSAPAEAFVSRNRSHWGKTFVGTNNVLVMITDEGAAYFSNSERTNVYICPADTAPIFEAIAAGKLHRQDE